MAVEIRQLVIRCDVRSDASAPADPAPAEARHRPPSRELLAAIDRRIEEALRRVRER